MKQQLSVTSATGGTGSCAGAPSSNVSKRTLQYARRSVLDQPTQLWLTEMPASAAAVAKATQAHQLFPYAELWVVIARCLTRMSFAPADYAVHARQPWMACLFP